MPEPKHDVVDITTEQVRTWPFIVKDGRGRPCAIDGVPTTADNDPACADSVVEAQIDPATGQPKLGYWNLKVFGITPTPTDTTGAPMPTRTTITIDADLTPEGTDNLLGFVDYTVSMDPRTGAKVMEFGDSTVEDKPISPAK
jgi:hypothetical protein